jgi:hypothetical protein
MSANAWEAIIEMIKTFHDRLKLIERRLEDQDALEENDAREPEMPIGPGSPLQSGSPIQYVTIVQSVFEDSRLAYVRKALPCTDSATPWAIDSTDTTLISAYVPFNMPTPLVGDALLVTFTGVTSAGARYGVFGGAPVQERWLVNSIFADVLYCTKLNTLSSMTSTAGYVVKPLDLKKSTFNGKVIDGWTYAYVSTQVRTATHATEDAEYHEVSPPYVPGVSEIVVERLGNGYGPVSDVGVTSVLGIDKNNAGRAWLNVIGGGA